MQKLTEKCAACNYKYWWTSGRESHPVTTEAAYLTSIIFHHAYVVISIWTTRYYLSIYLYSPWLGPWLRTVNTILTLYTYKIKHWQVSQVPDLTTRAVASRRPRLLVMEAIVLSRGRSGYCVIKLIIEQRRQSGWSYGIRNVHCSCIFRWGFCR